MSGVSTAHAETPKENFATRAEAATILLQARIGYVPHDTNKGRFSDIEARSWYEKYVLYAVKFGILSPDIGTQNVRPKDSVSRSEFLKMLQATFGLQENIPYTYRDVPPNAWYARYAGLAEEYQLFFSDPDKSFFQPDKQVNRIELALLMRQFLEASDTTSAAVAEQAELSKKQSLYKLAIYQSNSTEEKEIPIIPIPVYQAPAPSFKEHDSTERSLVPALHAQEIIVPVNLDTDTVDALRKRIIELTNAERKSKGLPSLREDTSMNKSAQLYADAMYAQNFFSHVSPEGQTLSDRMRNAGYSQNLLPSNCVCIQRYVFAENLTHGATTPAVAIKSWMDSKSHREAILNGTFVSIGIGIRGTYWVQHFAGVKVEE